VTRLPDALHDLVEWEIEVAYHQGYRAALADVAAGQVELDTAWRPVGRRRRGRLIAERLTEMERHARLVRARLDGWSRANPAPTQAAWPPVAEPGRTARTRPDPRQPPGRRPAAA
jgi:hypothetical protein